jgi:hypothetical protein
LPHRGIACVVAPSAACAATVAPNGVFVVHRYCPYALEFAWVAATGKTEPRECAMSHSEASPIGRLQDPSLRWVACRIVEHSKTPHWPIPGPARRWFVVPSCCSIVVVLLLLLFPSCSASGQHCANFECHTTYRVAVLKCKLPLLHVGLVQLSVGIDIFLCSNEQLESLR